MSTTNIQTRKDPALRQGEAGPQAGPDYKLTFVDRPFFLVSMIRQIRELWRTPKITVPKKYYRGQGELPVTGMRPWFLDIPDQFRALFEKPKPPAIPLTSKPVDVPNMWQDYQQQPASWVNAVIVHVVVVLALALPFWIHIQHVKAVAKFEITPIAPYMPDLQGPDNRTGGGGGGGDRTPKPASQGAIPKFAKLQFTPPQAVLPNVNPKLPMQPTILGPPALKLPQMAENMPWGDPEGVPGPPSNGPGYGGGIGTGTGTGVGSGTGTGYGPGEGGGFGGGAYSVGGGVSSPIPIYEPQPPYSEEARKVKYQGTVLLWIIVDAQGNVSDIRVVKPAGLGLDEKAVDTVRTWKFKPGMRNGSPVPVRVQVEVSFRLL